MRWPLQHALALPAGVLQADPGVADLIKHTFGIHPGMSMKQQAATFKYVLVLDGNGPPSARSMELMRLGILPL